MNRYANYINAEELMSRVEVLVPSRYVEELAGVVHLIVRFKRRDQVTRTTLVPSA